MLTGSAAEVARPALSECPLKLFPGKARMSNRSFDNQSYRYGRTPIRAGSSIQRRKRLPCRLRARSVALRRDFPMVPSNDANQIRVSLQHASSASRQSSPRLSERCLPHIRKASLLTNSMPPSDGHPFHFLRQLPYCEPVSCLHNFTKLTLLNDFPSRRETDGKVRFLTK